MFGAQPKINSNPLHDKLLVKNGEVITSGVSQLSAMNQWEVDA